MPNIELLELFSCLIGSKAYGLETPDSDTDIRGVVIPKDLSYYFGLNVFQDKTYLDEEDHVAWSLKMFAKMAADSNTQTMEMLYSPDSCVLNVNPVFKHYLIDERHQFITTKINSVIKGYALSEHEKAMGRSSRDLGDRRKQDLAQHGYSGRNASHCIRIMYCGTQALLTGIFPVLLPEPVRTICMNLKTSITSAQEYEQLFKEYLENLRQAGIKSKLPLEPDYDWLNKTLVKVHQEVL